MKKSFLSKLIAFAVACLEPLHKAMFNYQTKTGMVLGVGDWVPTAADFDAARVTNPNQSEVLRQRLYDSLLYPTAGVGQLSFFSTPVGQGITTAAGAAVGSAKSTFDTNQALQNQLPSGQSYMIESIEVLFLPGSVSTANTYTPASMTLFNAVAALAVFSQVADVNSFYQSGQLEFNVLNKNYLREQPLLAFPPKAHIDLSAGVASNSATTSTVGAVLAKASGRPYYVQPVISLQAAVNFEVLLKWPAVVATPSGFNARVIVYLDGYLARASQ